MAQGSARQVALAALELWRSEKCFADSVISGLLAKADLTFYDRAFALELFYGVLRNLMLLDFWIRYLRHHVVSNEESNNIATRSVKLITRSEGELNHLPVLDIILK